MSFWTSNTLSLRLHGPDGDESIELAQPYAIVGSSKDCDVVVDSRKVANRGLLLIATRNGVRAIVLSSKAKQPGRLMKVDPDRSLKFGGYEISSAVTTCESSVESSPIVELSQAVESSPADEATKAVDASETICAVTWKSEDSTRRFVQLPESVPMLVGRKSPAKIQLDNDRLSGVHCCLLRVDETLWVIDLNSSNGTVVSGETIRCAAVASGKSLVIGGQRLHFARFHTDEMVRGIETERGVAAAANDRLVEDLMLDYRRLKSKLEESSDAMHTQLADKDRELSEHSESLDTLRTAREQVAADLAAAAVEKDELQQELERTIAANADKQAQFLQQIEDYEQQAAAIQSEAMAAAERANEALRGREGELERLKQELETERRILDHLKIDIQPTSRPAMSTIKDDSCISSFDFQEVLEEALESLPTIEEKS